MSSYVLWHNPRCSKSRGALALLEERGIAPRVVRYLDTPPSTAEIERVLALLGVGPRELMRTKEALYGELGLSDPSLSHDQLVAAMVANPALIERPVLIRDDRAAVVGRPPEAILALLDDGE